jgi:hypothetical protein
MKCIECSFESDDPKKFRHRGNRPGWCNKCADRQKAADYRLRKFGKKEPRRKFTDEEKRLRAKKYYLDNREKHRECEKLYRENNREKINKRQTLYREANREKCRERCLSHYYRNKDTTGNINKKIKRKLKSMASGIVKDILKEIKRIGELPKSVMRSGMQRKSDRTRFLIIMLRKGT